MSTMSDRERWDQKYLNQQASSGSPVKVLLENSHLLPTSGRALEIACGLGANALWLAGRGLEVHAWDVSGVAIERLDAEAARRGVLVNTQRRDVRQEPPRAGAWDLIVITRFLERTIAPAVIAALRPGGVLVYQTFTQARVGSGGPRRSAYRLGEGELLALFSGLRPVVYREEGLTGDTTQGVRDQAILVAQRPTDSACGDRSAAVLRKDPQAGS